MNVNELSRKKTIIRKNEEVNKEVSKHANIAKLKKKLKNKFVNKDDVLDEIDGIEESLRCNDEKELNIMITNSTNEIAKCLTESKYVLFNILSNEYITVKCSRQKLSELVSILIQHKYVDDKPIDDETFLNNNKAIYNKYFE